MFVFYNKVSYIWRVWHCLRRLMTSWYFAVINIENLVNSFTRLWRLVRNSQLASLVSDESIKGFRGWKREKRRHAFCWEDDRRWDFSIFKNPYGYRDRFSINKTPWFVDCRWHLSSRYRQDNSFGVRWMRSTPLSFDGAKECQSPQLAIKFPTGTFNVIQSSIVAKELAF